jgi:IS605 OrfB family transposase
VDFFIDIRQKEGKGFKEIIGQKAQVRMMEKLTHRTQKNPEPRYDFDARFYKFPSYYRRAAMAEALGKVAAYEKNLENWKAISKGKKPGKPSAGQVYPTLYHEKSYLRPEELSARIKVWVRNTWDWIAVPLRKTDVDYIRRHCASRKECVPTLKRCHKYWVLSFPFRESARINSVPVESQTIVSVDLGINSASVCSVMRADGTVLGRRFLNLHKEEDCLLHAMNKIRKAQQNGARRTPKLWAKVKGINKSISLQTAQFIMEAARQYAADVIVFEHLELKGRARGRKKQRIHFWRAKSVQRIVENAAHRAGIRVSSVNAKRTSVLAFDGSGTVSRGANAGFTNSTLCRFQNGKIYNCDLNASYNIGARYFIREILKSCPEKERWLIEANVPQCSRRSTCTLSTLISLNAELAPGVRAG